MRRRVQFAPAVIQVRDSQSLVFDEKLGIRVQWPRGATYNPPSIAAHRRIMEMFASDKRSEFMATDAPVLAIESSPDDEGIAAILNGEPWKL